MDELNGEIGERVGRSEVEERWSGRGRRWSESEIFWSGAGSAVGGWRIRFLCRGWCLERAHEREL